MLPDHAETDVKAVERKIVISSNIPIEIVACALLLLLVEGCDIGIISRVGGLALLPLRVFRKGGGWSILGTIIIIHSACLMSPGLGSSS